MNLRLFDVGIFFAHIKEIGEFHRNCVVVASAEDVLLGIVVEISKAIIISAFQYEMAYLRAKFQTRAGSNAVVDAPLHAQVVLRAETVGTVGQAGGGVQSPRRTAL